MAVCAVFISVSLCLTMFFKDDLSTEILQHQLFFKSKYSKKRNNNNVSRILSFPGLESGFLNTVNPE